MVFLAPPEELLVRFDALALDLGDFVAALEELRAALLDFFLAALLELFLAALLELFAELELPAPPLLVRLPLVPPARAPLLVPADFPRAPPDDCLLPRRAFVEPLAWAIQSLQSLDFRVTRVIPG